MSLGRKIVALFLLLGVSFSLGSYAVLKLTIFPAFQDLETESTEAALLRVDRAIRADLHDLRIKNMEYSRWSQTYEFASHRHPDFVSANLSPAHWRSSNVHMFAIFDREGRRLYGEIQDKQTAEILSLDEEFIQPLEYGHPLVTRSSELDSLAGIIETRSGIMQVVSYPVLNDDGSGLVAGSLVVGRFLNSNRIADIGERTMANITLHKKHDGHMALERSDSVSANQMDVSSGGGDKAVFGYQVLKDIYGNTVASLAVRTPHKISRIGTELTRTVALLMFLLSAVFLVASLLFMRRLIVLPLAHLTDQILDIRKTGDLKFEQKIKGSGEIGLLSSEFAAMTNELGKGQERLKRARDNALATSTAKSNFLARMSHEIRTPMNGVLGMTELLRNTTLLPKQIKYADTIYDSAHSLLNTINDILDFSKIEAGKVELESVDVHLGAIVDETLQSLAGYAHTQGIELMAVVPQELNLLVKTDPVRLRQVLNNLISNAIKFTHEGEVVVRLSKSNDKHESGYCSVCFEVRDTGIGIAPEQQGEIFESFTQADGSTTRLYGGSGLGLTICKQLIDQLGGELKVDSVPNQGSVFSFSLAMQTSHNMAADAAAQMQCVAGKRVLIVDDNTTSREILENQLDGCRAQADAIDSDKNVYSHLVAAYEKGEPYELAILDMHLPDLSGLELVRKVRADSRLVSIKILLLSSIATPVSRRELEELNIGVQLSRPVSQSQLYNALALIMGEPNARDTMLSENLSTDRQLSGRILVVEDNEVNRLVAMSMLESLGLSVVLANNGLEAVEKYSSDSFDLILMDCQLPVMDGLKATETIRLQEAQTSRTRTPIVAATANALDNDREQCLTSGMDECLIKPFTCEQLHSVLALYLSAPAAAKGSELVTGVEPDAALGEGTGMRDSVIDEATLSRLSQLQQPGAPNMLRNLLSLYLQSSVVIKDRLSDAIDCADAPVVRETAHALKSCSLNVGATGLAELCKQLEGMGRNEAIADPPAMRTKLNIEYGRVVTAVNSELRGMHA